MNLYRDKPEWMLDAYDGEKVIGWALRTTPSGSVAVPIGYMVITDGGYLEANMDGIITRAKTLNMMEAS